LPNSQLVYCIEISYSQALYLKCLIDNIPKYDKFEITFQVESTSASNLEFPFDPIPSNPQSTGNSFDLDVMLDAAGQDVDGVDLVI